MPDRQLFRAGATIVAVVVVATITAIHRIVCEIRKTARPVADAWEEGFENGCDRGWRDCEREQQPIIRRLNHNT